MSKKARDYKKWLRQYYAKTKAYDAKVHRSYYKSPFETEAANPEEGWKDTIEPTKEQRFWMRMYSSGQMGGL